MAMRFLPAVVMVIVMMTSRCLGCRMGVQLKCLTRPVTSWCNIDLTIGEASNPLPCNQMLDDQQAQELQQLPSLIVNPTDGMQDQLPASVLFFMFDVDAPEKPVNEADGWVHTVAKATIQEDGVVKIDEYLPDKSFRGPNPPPGGPHHYQILLFKYEGSLDNIVLMSKNVDQMCNFMESNGLAPPLAATQFQYERF